MYHSITFYGNDGKTYNTWSDWHMIPSSRPTISHPTLRTSYVNIPGMSGSIDITDYLYSKPIYNDRTGSIQFYVMEGYADRRLVETDILRVLHGQKVKFVFEDDPNYYYKGRWTLEMWRNDPARPMALMRYTAEPYKYNLKTNARVLDDF